VPESSSVLPLPTALGRQLRLVHEHPSFRLLFLATLGSGIGTWLAVIALQVDVADRTDSGAWIAALLVANFLPTVVVGIVLGPLLDRLSRKRLMIVSDLARLAAFAALPFTSSALAIVLLALVAGVAGAFFRPAVLAGVPNMVDSAQVADANSALQVSEWATTAAGPLAGGAIVAASGPHLAYWLNAATFLVSAALILRIPARLLQSEQSLGRGHWRELGEGFRVVRGSIALVTVLVSWTIAMISIAAINVAEIFLARESYDSGDFGFGLLWAGTGVGLVLGSVVAPDQIERRGLHAVYSAALVVFGLGIGLAAAVPDVWLGTAAMVVAGFGNGAAVISNITFIQRGVPDRVRGRAFTLIISATNGMLVLAFLAAGPVTDAVGPRWVYAISAGILAVSAMTAAAIGRRASVAVPEPAA
jgi:MFS family permease